MSDPLGYVVAIAARCSPEEGSGSRGRSRKDDLATVEEPRGVEEVHELLPVHSLFEERDPVVFVVTDVLHGPTQ